MAGFSGQDHDKMGFWYTEGKNLETSGVDVLGLHPDTGRMSWQRKHDNELKTFLIQNGIHLGYQGDEFRAFKQGSEVFSMEVFSRHGHYSDLLKAALRQSDLLYGLMASLVVALGNVKYNELELLIRKI